MGSTEGINHRDTEAQREEAEEEFESEEYKKPSHT
jgi:hypothetical protein